MNQLENSKQFDVEGIRKQIAEIGLKESGKPGGETTSRPLNEYASRIAMQFAADSHKPVMVNGMLRIGEGVLMALMLILIYFGSRAEIGHNMVVALGAAIASAAITVLVIQFSDGYQVPVLRSPRRGILRAVAAWTVTCAVLAAVLLATRHDLMPGLHGLLFWFASGALLIAAARTTVAFAIRRWSRNGFMERRAIIVGGGVPARDLIRQIESQQDNDIRICGIFDDRDERRSPDLVAGYPKLGTFEELVEFSRLAHIDMMIISLPLTAEARILELLRKLWILPVDIRIAAHANKLRFRPRTYSHIGQVSMLDVFDRPITDWDSVAKRAFDIFFSSLAILFLWPVMLAAAIAVKLTSKGPAIFVQDRHGFNNEVIKVYKFRSMYTEMSDPSARNAVTRNDPRVTPVGRFLRRSSIDELPQFFNVLQGSLSLVGPRPHAILAQSADRKYADVVESYFARHKVKPGVTGWAQINGWRGEIDSDEKIKFRTAHDLYYIENWSLWLDLKILFLTPFSLLNTENAY
jgi:Undecaprenyl-phosphate glucose phosphotransferase